MRYPERAATAAQDKFVRMLRFPSFGQRVIAARKFLWGLLAGGHASLFVIAGLDPAIHLLRKSLFEE
jgi:hypothetical protein